MALKLDDLLVKKKEPVQILDLSKSTANSKEELKKLLEKVPEYKIKMDKIRLEDIKIYDKKFSFKISKKEEIVKAFPFANPVPSEMKSLRLEDLYSVNIQWKMLTSLRPKAKLDEEYFSKLVELGKLQLSSREKEKKRPKTSFIQKSKNKAGILETRITSCRDCGEDFCNREICHVFAYESYERSSDQPTIAEELAGQENLTKEKRKRKKKKIKKKLSPKRKPNKKITVMEKSMKKLTINQRQKHTPVITVPSKLKKGSKIHLKIQKKSKNKIANGKSKDSAIKSEITSIGKKKTLAAVKHERTSPTRK